MLAARMAKQRENMNEKKKEKKLKKKRKKHIMHMLLLFIIISVWTWYPFTDRKVIDIPNKEVMPVKIVLISDLHSCYYGPNQSWLIKMVDKENPDIVILAGDIFDDRIKDDNAVILCENLAKEYPCYYVTGNHEYWSDREDEMCTKAANAGVTVLRGDCDTITVNGTTLDICGVDDPDEIGLSQWKAQIDSAYSKTDDEHVKILISHRPEKVSIYEQYDFDIICSGHAHAGQVKIPWMNKGVYAPDQGFMAEYIDGEYTLFSGTILEVSRGLARESTPLPRYFNHPEIVSIEIH